MAMVPSDTADVPDAIADANASPDVAEKEAPPKTVPPVTVDAVKAVPEALETQVEGMSDDLPDVVDIDSVLEVCEVAAEPKDEPTQDDDVVDIDAQPDIAPVPVATVIDDDIEVVSEDVAVVVTGTNEEAMQRRTISMGDDVCVVVAPDAEEVVVKQVCDNCQAPLPDAAQRGVTPHLVVSRCGHALCAKCGAMAVANVLHKREDGGPVCGDLREYALCPVRRCRAPLSSEESATALSPDGVDACFENAFNIFGAVAESRGPLDIFGNDISMSAVSTEVTAKALAIAGTDAFGEWFTDDLRGAYSPLWVNADARRGAPLSKRGRLRGGPSKAANVRNGVTSLPSAAGASSNADAAFDDSTARWFCAACGKPHVPKRDAVRASGESAEDDESTSPDYLHCALARSHGFLLATQGLLKAKEAAEATAKCRKRVTRKRRVDPPVEEENPYYMKKPKIGTGFAKGTGYGGRGGVEWKGLSKTFLNKIERADASTAFWLSRIRCFLVQEASATSFATWPGFLRALVRKTDLMRVICQILVNDSIMDVGERVLVYVSALRIVNALADVAFLRPLLLETSDAAQKRSVIDLVSSLGRQAALLSNGMKEDQVDAKTSVLIRQIRRCIRGLKRYSLTSVVLPGGRSQDPAPVTVMGGEVDVDAPVDADAPAAGSGAAGFEEYSIADEAEITQAEKDAYVEQVGPLQFDTVEGLAKQSHFHGQMSSSAHGTAGVGRGSAMRRIAGEVASLSCSLPLNWSSSIFVRVDQDRYDFLQACVTGPEGSPYASGCFVFDIFLPPGYPSVPPKFHLRTTGNGRVRFNPNLYACGKVCLSLLGTWSGPGWTSASTLLQVLVSIQSLILVEQPFFNEPGYESYVNSPRGVRDSACYNADLRRNTALHAIHANIRQPPAHLAHVMRAHFRLRRRAIRQAFGRWFPRSVSQLTGMPPSTLHPTPAPLPPPPHAHPLGMLIPVPPEGHATSFTPTHPFLPTPSVAAALRLNIPPPRPTKSLLPAVAYALATPGVPLPPGAPLPLPAPRGPCACTPPGTTSAGACAPACPLRTAHELQLTLAQRAAEPLCDPSRALAPVDCRRVLAELDALRTRT